MSDQVKSGHVWSGRENLGQVRLFRSGQVISDLVGSGQVRSGQVRSGKVSLSQVGAGQNRSGQVRSFWGRNNNYSTLLHF